jgi:replicative DNA helicase
MMATTTKTPIGTRILPHDVDAEQELLGSILLDGDCITKIINQIRVKDFFSERHQSIYQSCLDLFYRKEKINLVTVGQELARKDILEKIGNASYLSHLTSTMATSLDIESFAEIVYRCGVSRETIELAKIIGNLGFENNPDVTATIQRVQELCGNFKRDNNVNGNKLITPYVAASDIINLLSKYNDIENKKMSWGFIDLDAITAGIYPEYVIIGARPSIGKTQLMIDIAENVAQKQYKVLFVSAEMAKEQLYERKLARKVETRILDIRKRGLKIKEQDALVNLASEVSESSMSYLAGGVYLKDVYREVSVLKEKGLVDIVFIDYLGALRDCYDERENQTVRTSRVSNKLQDMVHEFNIPFIVAAQLNREVEHRTDFKNKEEQTKSKPPQLSDLRDSGSLEQDADVVFLLHREENNDGTLSNLLKVCMRKNRQLGSAKSITLQFHDKYRRYVDMVWEGN